MTDVMSTFASWTSTSTAIILVLLVVAILSVLWLTLSSSVPSRHRAGSSLPSPKAPLPSWLGVLGGHTLLLDKEKMVQQFEAWADEFGGDYELHVFGTRTIVVTSVADMRRILALRPSKFKRGLTPTHFRWAAEKVGIRQAMFTEEGKEWGRSRRLISPSLNGHNVTDMIPHIAKVGERLCTKLSELADDRQKIDAIEEFERYTHDVVALVAFGIDTNSVSATVDRPCASFDGMRSLVDAMMSLMCQPLARLGWDVIPSMLPWVRRTKEYSLKLQDVLVRRIEEVRRESRGGRDASTAGGPLLRKIVSSTNDVAGGKRSDAKSASSRMTMSDREIVDQAKSLFVAGTSTTASTLVWTAYYLAKHPRVAARCRKEALRVAPSSDGMISTSEQLSQLVYTSAVFKEALRLRTPGTTLFLHSAEAVTMKDGRVLDAGTGINLLPRYASLSDDNFTRAGDFVPERWIDAERDEALLGTRAGEDGNAVAHVEDAVLSFGGGPRVCPGQDIAKAEASIILAALCARFDFALAPGQADPPEEIMAFTSGPKAVKLVLSRSTA